MTFCSIVSFVTWLSGAFRSIRDLKINKMIILFDESSKQLGENNGSFVEPS